MSFGGPIDSMLNSNRQNLRQLSKRKQLKDIQLEFGSKSSVKKPLKFKQPTSRGWSRFQSQQKLNRRNDRIRFALIVGITLIIMMLILLMVIKANYTAIIEVIK